ncbi:MAG TPA: tRNA epoxyqueuosine(34) reductase QueG [Acidimicrobiales bacterium]|nr:tRNA epoxyqueuosine(34) reductase QueG [Acidimicrobiales bacterium]
MTTEGCFTEASSSIRVAGQRRTPAEPLQGLGELAERLRQRGEQAGLAAIGIALATPMEATRRILEERKDAGLSADMQFTYRNPTRSTDPRRALPEAAALVVGAWPYGEASREDWDNEHISVPGIDRGRSPVGPDRPQGRVARYARRDHYLDLRKALGQVATELTGAGWRARVVADDNALVDRAAAERAGLGWFGKNSNILLAGRGSWFLLGSVITDAPLPASAPVEDGCGSCRRCLTSCPTGALVAPGVLDARKCLAWLLQATGVFPVEYRAALEGRIYGCDDCQEVCPVNRLAARMADDSHGERTNQANGRIKVAAAAADVAVAQAEPAEPAQPAKVQQAPEGGPAGQEAEVDLLDLLSNDDESLLARYGRWYIPQRDPRYLRRNALIALGNVADGHQPEVEETLGRYLDDPDELLRAHAVWASFRAGRHDLVAARPSLLGDQSPIVRQELARQADVAAHLTARPALPTQRPV